MRIYLKKCISTSIVTSCILLLSGIFIAISLFTHNPKDASCVFLESGNYYISNWFGIYGAHCAAVFFLLFGPAAYLWIPIPFISGMYCYKERLKQFVFDEWDRILGYILLALSISALLSWYYAHNLFWIKGGICGNLLYEVTREYFGAIITGIFLHLVLLISLILLFRFPFARIINIGSFIAHQFIFNKRLWRKMIIVFYSTSIWISKLTAFTLRQTALFFQGKTVEKSVITLEFDQLVQEEYFKLVKDLQPQSEEKKLAFTKEKDIQESTNYIQEKKEQKNLKEVSYKKHEQTDRFKIPDIKHFFSYQKSTDTQSQNETQTFAKILEEKLKRFGVSGKVVSIKSGPVITLFEYEPEIDSKLSKIIALEDDLALALQAVSIRIIAPIPGTSYVGFEVANKKRNTVLLADVLRAHTNFDGDLPIILGQNTVGQNVVVDLCKMPHLLIAGSTGSGKSVALSTILFSLLLKCTPEDLQLVLIDPKRLEFATFADIPHLVFPIITDPNRAKLALQWLVNKMDERYEKMAALGVRNIFDYHTLAQNDPSLPNLPFIVLMVDELSDLMMTTGRDVEGYIARLAQMARAAGIHLIVATQRPSVDVLTGVIKVNFPSRISFKVTSKVDSRTILDCTGAEKLLGRGDMLFLNSGSELERIHGAFTSHQDVVKLVNYLKSQREPKYHDLEKEIPKNQSALSEEDEKLYQEVIAFIKTVDSVSISLLQRRFRIGYNRSARIIDMLEADGLIMSADGGKTRKVVQ